MQKVLCFEYKVVSVEYFLDQMQHYEIEDCIENIKYSNKESWEQTRFQVYANAQMNTKKTLKPTDILKLPWDDETGDGKEQEISKEEIERLRKRSEQIILNKLNKNGK